METSASGGFLTDATAKLLRTQYHTDSQATTVGARIQSANPILPYSQHTISNGAGYPQTQLTHQNGSDGASFNRITMYSANQSGVTNPTLFRTLAGYEAGVTAASVLND